MKTVDYAANCQECVILIQQMLAERQGKGQSISASFQLLTHDHLQILNLSININYIYLGTSLVAQLVKNPPAMQETLVQFLGWEDPLEKG